MRKNKLLKLTALVLSTVMLAGAGYTALPVEAETSGTYEGFESGVLPTTGFEGSVDDANNGVIAQLDYTKAYKGDAYTDSAYYWNGGTNTLPKTIKFRFLCNDSSYDYDQLLCWEITGAQITTGGRLGRGLSKIFTKAKEKVKLQTTGKITETVNATEVFAYTEGKWLDFEINCDWTQYNTSTKNCTITQKILLDGTIIYDDTATYTKGTSTSNNTWGNSTMYFVLNFRKIDASKYSSNLSRYLDNVQITWTNYSSDETIGTAEYTPSFEPELKVLGATLATNESNESIPSRFEFNFSEAKAALDNKGETPVQYGAVLRAGTQTYDTMKVDAALLLDDDTANDPKSTLTKRTIDTTGLPDEYKVTVQNSMKETADTKWDANLGKRVTAIGYIVTDKGNIYYTGGYTNAADDDKAISRSVVGILKNIFKAKYVDALTEDIVSKYKNIEGVAYSVDSVKTLLDLTGVTTTQDREMLMKVHFALNDVTE